MVRKMMCGVTYETREDETQAEADHWKKLYIETNEGYIKLFNKYNELKRSILNG